MAELEKFTDSSIVMLLKHDERKLKNDSNKEIDSSRSGLNYSIPCNTTGLSDLDYYKQLLGNSYLYGRGSKRECKEQIHTLEKSLEIQKEHTIQEPEQAWGKSADWGQKNSSWGTREHIYDKIKHGHHHPPYL